MQLKTFNPINLPNTRTSSAKIGIASKSGTIRFNAAAVEKMSLTKNCLVQFHNDEKAPADWYLEIVEKDGFLLRQKQNVVGGGGLLTQSCGLVNAIFSSVKFTGNAGNLFIAPESIKYEKRILWPLSLRDLKKP